MKHSQEEICEIAEELERVSRARKTYRRRELTACRDYFSKAIDPGQRGVMLAFPGDVPCCPDAIPECLTVDSRPRWSRAFRYRPPPASATWT